MDSQNYFLRRITWLDGIPHGWGNGYVALPKDHKYYGVDYDSIPVDIHGGLTFSDEWQDWMPEEFKDCWIVGFDTAHYGDNHTKQEVENETIHLRNQLYGSAK